VGSASGENINHHRRGKEQSVICSQRRQSAGLNLFAQPSGGDAKSPGHCAQTNELFCRIHAPRIERGSEKL